MFLRLQMTVYYRVYDFGIQKVVYCQFFYFLQWIYKKIF